jgi:uncharacterized protein with NRDE domain
MTGRCWRRPIATRWRAGPGIRRGGIGPTGRKCWPGATGSPRAAGSASTILNRPGTLGPAAGKRSRGELVLEALDHADAVEAGRALADLAPDAYRAFNLVVADNRDAYWLKNDERTVSLAELPAGFSMITAHDRNDPASPRIRRYLPRFEGAAVPDPSAGDWRSWTELLAERQPDQPREGMSVVTETGYGTVSSALIALPALGTDRRRPVFLFAAGRPGEAPYVPVGEFG